MTSIFILFVTTFTPLLIFTTLPMANCDYDNNPYLKSFILTGETLGQGGLLAYYGILAFLADGCRLTLYSYGTVRYITDQTSDTANCTLTLNNQGQLVIHDRDGHKKWASKQNPNAIKGKYAAVLDRNGQIVVYGPYVWSTTPVKCPRADTQILELDGQFEQNLLFSDQSSIEGFMMRTSTCVLVMSPDCDLKLFTESKGFIWSSGTEGMGENCTVGLNRMGQLTINEGSSERIIWTSGLESTEGEYVMILQADDQAVIYGPKVWSSDDEPDILG
ncbi:hypothetical protein LUZ60_004101 [Juncus effusus]|nr:hypothetical protein LUZ60_004101 [Juncus effusus]